MLAGGSKDRLLRNHFDAGMSLKLIIRNVQAITGDAWAGWTAIGRSDHAVSRCLAPRSESLSIGWTIYPYGWHSLGDCQVQRAAINSHHQTRALEQSGKLADGFSGDDTGWSRRCSGHLLQHVTFMFSACKHKAQGGGPRVPGKPRRAGCPGRRFPQLYCSSRPRMDHHSVNVWSDTLFFQPSVNPFLLLWCGLEHDERIALRRVGFLQRSVSQCLQSSARKSQIGEREVLAGWPHRDV